MEPIDFKNTIARRIMIENLTDDRHKQIKIIKRDYPNFNWEMRYSFTDVDYKEKAYEQFIKELAEKQDTEIIRMIHIRAHCDYRKFQQKQLHQFGRITTGNSMYPIKFGVDPNQFQDTIVAINTTGYKETNGIPFNKDTEFEIDYLMPDTQMEVTLISELQK